MLKRVKYTCIMFHFISEFLDDLELNSIIIENFKIIQEQLY